MQINQLPPASSLNNSDKFAVDTTDGITKSITASALVALTRTNSYGSPLVADTVTAMTDTSKVYVYTGNETGYTNGDWYYYNGTAWVSGGAYNSVAVNTDTTLTLSGVAADAKAVGDADASLAADIAALDGTLSDQIEDIFLNTATDYDSLSFPVSEGQYCLRRTNLFKARQDIPTIEAWNIAHWERVNVGNELYGIGEGSESAVAAEATARVAADNDIKTYYVTANGSFATLINAGADVNDYTTPGNYRVGSSTAAAQIANLPYARAGRLTVDGLTDQSGSLQKYVTTTGTIYRRVKQNNVWGEWAEIATTSQVESESSAREAAVSAEAAARESDVNTINSDIDHIAGNYVDFSNIGSTGGVTFTIVGGEVTATGTAESNIVFPLADITGVSHILYGGCADGGGANTYFIGLYDMDSSGTRIDYVLDSGYKLISIDDTKHYRVSLAILSGTTVSNAVFKPFVCTNGLLLDTIIQSNGLSSDAASIGRYRWFNGTCFITVCGNSVFVDMQGLRLYDRKQKTYTAYGVYSSTKLPLTTNTIRYILFDGTNFSLSGEYDDTAIAYSYQMNVVPLIDNIHVNCRPVQDGYIRSNSEYYINYDRMPINVYGEYTSNDVKTGNRSYIYKSAGTKKYSDAKSIMSFSLTENTTSIANKKILMIGDSFVARGFIQNYLKEFEPSLTFIGTKTTQNYDFKSEGVSGSRLYYFTNPDTSPFYIDGALNFSRYLSDNNLEAPDYVVINSAINHNAFESEYGTYLENLNTLINMIRAYSTTIKIYVTYGANYAMVPGSVYGYPNRRWEAVRTCCNSIYAADNIVVVPIDTILIDELDYVYANYDYFGDTLRILSDCVHPAENTGFKKIATMIYNYLGV